jgi:CBS domain-containing protein
MTTRIADLMAKRVLTAAPHHTVGHLRGIMERNRIHAVPVIGTNEEPLGIVTTADLARRVKDESPVSRIMTKEVTVVPAYNDAATAARIMRRRKIHHVVVTHEKKVIGIISSFDLLKLVEGHRYVEKNAPAGGKKAKRG